MESSQPLALIIDSDECGSSLLGRTLQDQGFACKITRDFEKLDDYLEGECPSLVFIEHKTGDSRALDICRDLHKNPCAADTQFILLSEENNDDIVNAAMDAGATDLIVKPFQTSLLRLRIQNIIRSHRYEKQARHLAYHDALTGLPNRLLLIDRIEHAIARASRQSKIVALLLLDLDEFKLINDTHGHDLGDELLAEVAIRLTGQTSGMDTVARISGDEFIVMLESIDSPAVAALNAQRINESLAIPFTVGGETLRVTCSIGIAMAPIDGRNIGRLIKRADTAMYKAKEAGRNQFRFYMEEMEHQVADRLLMNNDLYKAIENREFTAFFQPQVSLATGDITGMEALVRWEHPKRGLISPAQFLPVAEENGLVVDISDSVLEQSCQMLRKWLDEGLNVPHVAVNLSTRHFHRPGLIERVKELLHRYDLRGDHIVLEITETTAMETPEKIVPILEDLKDIGVGLAIDDFGTGHSSLAYLKRFPFDTLKIDRAFIKDIVSDSDDKAIISGILSLGSLFSKQVVAEGVETIEQASLLLTMGCNIAQGYLFSRPVCADEMTILLQRQRLTPEPIPEVVAPRLGIVS